MRHSTARISHAPRKTPDTLWIEVESWRSDSSLALGISDRRFQIWNLRFGICNPEGHALVPEGLDFEPYFTKNTPG
jgi:hypothetical protein